MNFRSRVSATALAFVLSFAALVAFDADIASAARLTRCEAIFKPAEPLYEDTDLSTIIDSNGTEFHRSGFTTNRGLRHYTNLFRWRFKSAIEALTKADAVLDAGCGDGILSDSFFKPAPSLFDPFAMLPQMRNFVNGSQGYFDFRAGDEPTWIGVTKTLKERGLSFFSDRIRSPRFKLLLGHFFEEYNDAQLRQDRKIKVITDFFGVLSYSERPDLVLQTYLRLLEPGGTVFVGGEPGMLIAKLGRFPDLLRATKGIRFHQHAYDDGIGLVTTGFEIHLTGEKIEIPELDYIGAEYGAPPLRTYYLTGKTLKVPAKKPASA